jgi:RNA polymerase sigma-70 factor (ECF subfamily)
LIAAAQAGDEFAWQAIVAHVRPQLRASAARQLSPRVRRRADPSDVVQQSLAEAWVARADFAGRSKAELEKWLRRILERNLQDAVRRHIQTSKRSVDHERSFAEILSSGDFRPEVFLADELSPGSEIARRELLACVVSLLEALPRGQREAVKLRYLDRCSLAEMAARLDLNENAAAQLLHRGLQNLRRRYRQLQSSS